MKHHLMLQKLCNADELANIDPTLFKDDSALLNNLIESRIAMVLDYKFEPPQNVAEFIQNRLEKLSLKSVPLTADKIEQDFENDENDNFIDFMLRNFDRQLKKSGAKIILLETLSDYYLLFVVNKKHTKNLKSLKSDFWKFTNLAEKPNAKLYVIYCPNCDDMNVWELPFEATPPHNECCESCNTPLLDDKGNPCPDVKLEIDEIYLSHYN